MPKPDSQQRGLAGEYYVAAIITWLGYDIGITLGRAKVFDMMVAGPKGRTINMQVKTTYQGYDWLVAHKFDPASNSVVAFVRLGKDPKKQPELYFVPALKANKLITHKYPNHSRRISRAGILNKFKDHDFSLILQLLGE